MARTAVGAPAPRPTIEELIAAIAKLSVLEAIRVARAISCLK